MDFIIIMAQLRIHEIKDSCIAGNFREIQIFTIFVTQHEIRTAK